MSTTPLIPETPVPAATKRRQAPWRQLVADFGRSPAALAALIVAILLVLAAIFAPYITPQNPYDLLQLDVLDARLPPGSMSGTGTHAYWLGTDGQGRDLYSAMLYGRSGLGGDRGRSRHRVRPDRGLCGRQGR
jgi:peptide/nickel transport system permease protein